MYCIVPNQASANMPSKTKKIKINSKIYDKIKEEAGKVNQSVDEYVENLLNGLMNSGETVDKGADSS
jgi:hypothetical protein